jgi:hypothetical protein
MNKTILVILLLTGVARGQAAGSQAQIEQATSQILSLSVQAYEEENQSPAHARALEAQASQILDQLNLPVATANETKDLISVYYRAEEVCRHGQDTAHGENEDSNTIRACGARNATSLVLEHFGWCYGHEGQSEAEKEWEPSTAPAISGSPENGLKPPANVASMMDLAALSDKMCHDASTDDSVRKMGCANRDFELATIKSFGWWWHGGHWEIYR